MEDKSAEPLRKPQGVYKKHLFFKLTVYDEMGAVLNKFTWRIQDEFRKVLELIRLKYGFQYR